MKSKLVDDMRKLDSLLLAPANKCEGPMFPSSKLGIVRQPCLVQNLRRCARLCFCQEPLPGSLYRELTGAPNASLRLGRGPCFQAKYENLVSFDACHGFIIAMEDARVNRYQTKIRLHLDDVSHPATAQFLKLPNCADLLQYAIEQVHHHLYKYHGKPQAVRSVTLIVEHMGGVAYTTGIALDDLHKEIHMSLEYISHSMNDPVRFRDECTGVITHEMVHCYQHNGLGTAPGGLIEGIADYVRLKAGLAPPHWKRGKEDSGEKWDEGYQKTAFFLEWLEDKFGKGSISKLNARLDGQTYNEEKFWKGLFGSCVDDLWLDYQKSFDDDDARKPSSIVSTETELVDLSDGEREAASQAGMQAKEFRA